MEDVEATISGRWNFKTKLQTLGFIHLWKEAELEEICVAPSWNKILTLAVDTDIMMTSERRSYSC